MSDYQTTAQSRDVYEKVTDAIVNAIEQGAGQYRMPWVVRQDKGFSPISVSTVKPYRGVNTLVLWAQSQSKGYSSAFWGAYQQWQSLGGQVRKGEHGSPVVYWGTYESKNTTEEEQDERYSRHLFCKGYTVFNLDQVDGVEPPKRFEPKVSHNQRIALAEAFFASVRCPGSRRWEPRVLSAGQSRSVYMPGFDQFPERVDYYSTLAHETTHWTSHASRCDRQLGKRFGDAAYATEELIAELGSAYTMAWLELELTPRADHTAYIDSWLKVLKSDKRAIFTAASQAQKAADWLREQSGRNEQVAEVAA